jgi:hypothetical protein
MASVVAVSEISACLCSKVGDLTGDGSLLPVEDNVKGLSGLDVINLYPDGSYLYDVE